MSNNQTVNVALEMQQLERSIREYENAKASYTALLDEYRRQYVQVEQEIKNLGVNPQTIEQELMNLANEIKTGLVDLKAMMPANLVEELQTELNHPANDMIELPNFDIIC